MQFLTWLGKVLAIIFTGFGLILFFLVQAQEDRVMRDLHELQAQQMEQNKEYNWQH